MIEGQRPVEEEELHAYLDGALDPARRLAVAHYLANHPEDAARIEAFRAQQEALHLFFDRLLDQPVPDRLQRVIRRAGTRAVLRRCSWAIACVALLGVLLLGGHTLNGSVSEPRSAPVAIPPAPKDTGLPVILPAPRHRRQSADI